MFTKNQKRILLACAVLGAIGAIVLAIDNFIVNPDRASEQDLIVEAAEELRLELHQPYAQAEQLIEILQGFGEPVKPATEIGRVLKREDQQHRLWVYEHRYVRPRPLTHRSSDSEREVQLLGILIESLGPELPPLVRFPNGQFDTSDRERMESLVTPDLAQRLINLDEFSLVSAGQFLVMLSREPLVPLTAAIDRRRNPQFADGLANAALKIDVQRAIDIFNRLRPGEPPIADIYRLGNLSINIEINREPLVWDSEGRMERGMETYRQERDERRAQSNAELERIRAKNQARREEMNRQSAEAHAERMAAIRARGQQAREDLARVRSELLADIEFEPVGQSLSDEPEQPPKD